MRPNRLTWVYDIRDCVYSQSRSEVRFPDHKGALIIADNRPILIAILAGTLASVGGCDLFVAYANVIGQIVFRWVIPTG